MHHGDFMKTPLLVENHDGKPTVSWRGLCVTALLASALSVAGFLGFRFILELFLGETIDLLPGILLTATIPTGALLGKLLRTQLRSFRADSNDGKLTAN